MSLSEFAHLEANILCNQLILTHVISTSLIVSSEIRTDSYKNNMKSSLEIRPSQGGHDIYNTFS